MSYSNYLILFCCLYVAHNMLNFGVTGQVQTQGTAYVIQPGDTLKQIAQRFCGSENRWTQIRDFNNIKGDEIFAGSTLQLPPTCTARGGIETGQQQPQQPPQQTPQTAREGTGRVEVIPPVAPVGAAPGATGVAPGVEPVGRGA